MRATWPALVAMVVVMAGLAVLAADRSPGVAWIVFSFWAIIVLGFVIRGVAAALRRRSVRDAAGPAASAVDTYQNLYLGRKDLGPVVYGDETSPVAELTTDQRNPFEERIADVEGKD